MSHSQQKVVQYLGEAHTNELGLARTLQSQIAMTPEGAHRSALQEQLEETRGHALRVSERLRELDHGSHSMTAVIGFWERAMGQAVAVSKTSFDVMRGSRAEDKALKNARDACAVQAQQIATYTAVEQLARRVGDEDTATQAMSIRADEQRRLDCLLGAIPKLAEAVVGGTVTGGPSDAVATTGAVDESTTGAVDESAGPAEGTVATAQDLAIGHYDQLTAQEIIEKLRGLSQRELTKTECYEREHDGRSTVLNRIGSLRGDEPWPGYDELTVTEVQAALSGADEQRIDEVRAYERSHKNRAGVLNAVRGEPAPH